MLGCRSIRSVMFTPALRVDRFHRALESGADLCLLDCEDSIGDSGKVEARERLCSYLAQPANVDQLIAVRINAINTQEGLADIKALHKCVRVPDYVVVPKVEKRSDIVTAIRLLKCKKRNIGIIALVETVLGIQNVDEIAAVAGVNGLMFGSADYARSIEAEICWDTLLVPRMMIIHAASKNKIGAIDTPYFDISDISGLHDDCKRVKSLGFTGRCAIHPSQVSIINKMFSHSSAVIEQAKRIVIAAKENEGNICQIDGKMVGVPIINQALKILKLNNLSEVERYCF